jgi:hypothetical protein
MSLKISFATPTHKNPSAIIGFQPPQDHISGSGAQYNCPTLSYKRIRQAPLSDNLNSTQVQLSLEQRHTHSNTILFIEVGYYALTVQAM